MPLSMEGLDLDGFAHDRGTTGGDESRGGLPMCRSVTLGNDRVVQASADCLVARPAKDGLGAAVPAGDETAGVHADEGVVCGFDDSLRLLLGFPKSVAIPLALDGPAQLSSDVCHHAQQRRVGIGCVRRKELQNGYHLGPQQHREREPGSDRGVGRFLNPGGPGLFGRVHHPRRLAGGEDSTWESVSGSQWRVCAGVLKALVALGVVEMPGVGVHQLGSLRRHEVCVAYGPARRLTDSIEHGLQGDLERGVLIGDDRCHLEEVDECGFAP
jgi:hypothetical protein